MTPLEPDELAALGDTIALRAAITLCISHWRAADHPENATYIRGWDEISLSLLRQFEELGHEAVTAAARRAELAARHRRPRRIAAPPSSATRSPPSPTPSRSTW